MAKDVDFLSHFNDRRGVSGSVVEAADLGIIRRPRLWWSNGIEPGCSNCRWGTYDGIPRAFMFPQAAGRRDTDRVLAL